MKTVFSSHDEVSHIWASQSQQQGRAGNIFFEGEKIYSYGYHFCIARFAPEFGDIVLFTNRGYSNSTAKHKGIVSRAIPDNYRVIYCNDPERNSQSNIDYWANNVEHYRNEFNSKKHKISRGNLAVKIQQTIAEAWVYYDALKIPAPEWFTLNADELASIDYVTLRFIELEKKREIRREAIRIEQFKKAEERIQKWLNGEDTYTNDFYQLDTMLRIKGDRIQTSKGANIPVSDAISIYPLLARAKQSGKPLEMGLRTVNLGVYKFHSFDGNILTVGCHKIKWDQIEKMATQLNLIN
jgi:hypothetical protein